MTFTVKTINLTPKTDKTLSLLKHAVEMNSTPLVHKLLRKFPELCEEERVNPLTTGVFPISINYDNVEIKQTERISILLLGVIYNNQELIHYCVNHPDKKAINEHCSKYLSFLLYNSGGVHFLRRVLSEGDDERLWEDVVSMHLKTPVCQEVIEFLKKEWDFDLTEYNKVEKYIKIKTEITFK
jgi:hypothetical protein